MRIVPDGLFWRGALVLAVSTWAVKARATVCLLETVSQSVPGKGMGRETRPLVGYPIPIPPGPGRHSEAARGEDANQRQKSPYRRTLLRSPYTHTPTGTGDGAGEAAAFF